MGTVIPQRELRNNNARIIERVMHGESFVITRDGVPVAEMTPRGAGGAPPMFPSSATVVGSLAASEARSYTRAWLEDLRAGRDEPDEPDDVDQDPWSRHDDRPSTDRG